MSRQLTASVNDIHADNILACLKLAITLLNEVHDAFGTPFLLAIANTALSLTTVVQTVKKNKDECIQLMQYIHQVLYGIIAAHIKSETAGSLSPTTLNHLGKFTETIHKIYTFVEAQQEGNRIKIFLRQSEMNTLLKECHTRMQHALDVFKIESGATTWTSVKEMQTTAANMHEELLELITNLSDGITSDGASSMHQTLDGSHFSSESFSMLPAKPQIFHGRDSELKEIVQMLCQESARIAILGPGGIGKTSLARAVLHHPDITDRYEHQFFIPCDAATTSIEIASLIGAHLGLKPGKDLTKPVIQFLSRQSTTLLILDNLETSWEPISSRSSVEKLLGLLTDIHNLALIITMRGAERPAKVRWSHPFLVALKPLSTEAARQMFIDIAGDFHEPTDIEQLLHLTDNMPLAVDLIAHLVDYDGCSSVLSRWKTKRTTFLSKGNDKRSNLDTSISISLSSPRFASLPRAKDLLSLLSILPDGLSDVELFQAKLPIQDVLACKAVLLGTSLAFIDEKNRFKSLVPIREHMQYFHPVAPSLVHSLRRYFHALLDLHQQYFGVYQGAHRVDQISLNLANLHQVLLQGLDPKNPDFADTIKCTLSLNRFSQHAGHGWHALMNQIPDVLPQPYDHQLRAEVITEIMNSSRYHPIINAEHLVTHAMSHFNYLNEPGLECELIDSILLPVLIFSIARFYLAAGTYYSVHANNVLQGLNFFEKGLVIAKSARDTKVQAQISIQLAFLEWARGHYTTGQLHSTEAQRLAKLSSNLYLEAQALIMEGKCCRSLGQFKHSLSLLHKGQELLRLCGMNRGYASHMLMGDIAEVHMMKSEYAEARMIHLQIAQDTSPDQDLYTHAYACLGLAWIDVMIGQREEDVHHNLDKAKSLFSSVSYPLGQNPCERLLAELHLREGETATAKAIFHKYLQWSWGVDVEGSSHCLEKMADINQWGPSEFPWASRCTIVYFALANKSQTKLALHKSLHHLGDLFLAIGDEVTAENLFTVALEGFTWMDVHCSRARCMLQLGDLAKKHGDMTRAAALWSAARPLFKTSLQEKHGAQIDSRLTHLDREHKMAHIAGINVPIISLKNLTIAAESTAD